MFTGTKRKNSGRQKLFWGVSGTFVGTKIHVPFRLVDPLLDHNTTG